MHAFGVWLTDNGISLLALSWFLLCFHGYMRYARKRSFDTPCLASTLHMYRYEWMKRMLLREMRIADNTAIANLERSVSFFASTTMLILAGLMTILGSSEKAIGLVNDLPFVTPASRAEWELKIVVLIVLFVYAFFKFTWSLRQYGFVTIMIGGAPIPAEKAGPEALEAHANRIAKMASMAASNFNIGLRSYYFSIAVLGWFVNPWIFMLSSAGIVAVLYRREFKSSTLKTLMMSNGPAP